MKFDVTVIGEIYLDHVFTGFPGWPEPDTEIFSEGYKWELGGGAVNTACALARLGRRVRLVGVVGRDQLHSIEARLAAFDVSTKLFVAENEQTGVTVSLSIDQQRTLFSYRGANEALSALLQDSADLLDISAESRHIHMAFPLVASVADRTIPVLRSRGATLSLDVGHQVEWLRSNASLDVLRAVDYFMPNAKEVQLMYGSVAEYLQFCRDFGCKALVKLGAAGAVTLVEGQEVRSAAPQVQVVDTTGAGDAFDAGFIDGLLAGKEPAECLEQGCICGALSTRSTGALDTLPTLAEMAKFRSVHAA